MMTEIPKHVFWLNFQMGHGERAKYFSVPFETPLASIDAIIDVLDARGVVSGASLDLVNDGRGGKMIRSRTDFGFGTAGLVSIQAYSHRVWEPED